MHSRYIIAPQAAGVPDMVNAEDLARLRHVNAEDLARLRHVNAEDLTRLRQGVAVWNDWRARNRERNLDLRGLDFSGESRAQDLRKAAELERPDYSGTNRRRANLRKAKNLREAANLRWAMLRKVADNLQGVDLRGADLRGANLWQANLQQADLHRANLRGARLNNVNFGEANLSGAFLSEAILTQADLHKADLSGWAMLYDANLSEANLSEANLSGADLHRANLRGANLSGANLLKANLYEADFLKADLHGANLGGARSYQSNFYDANLQGVNLGEANLRGANLQGANLSEANLSGANLSEANLTQATLIKTNLTDANLTGCRIYGISAWDLKLEAVKQQRNLVITPIDQPKITVDNLEVAQFIYLLLHNEKIRSVIDTITSKVVLILGRFNDERKPVLDELRESLRRRNMLPIMFDFSIPTTLDVTETIKVLAGLSRFVIADVTDAAEVRVELHKIVPEFTLLPVQPILLFGQPEFFSLNHLKKFPWVLPTFEYENQNHLLASLEARVIEPAIKKHEELVG